MRSTQLFPRQPNRRRFLQLIPRSYGIEDEDTLQTIDRKLGRFNKIQICTPVGSDGRWSCDTISVWSLNQPTSSFKRR